MYQLVKKLTRPNIDIPWVDPWIETDTTVAAQHKEYFKVNYIDTGKQVFRHAEDNESGLERTVIVLWESKEIWEEFDSDPVMKDIRSIHSQNIASAGIMEETVSLSEI